MSAEITGEMHSALNRRMARGATWMIGLRLTDRLLGFLSTIVLARLLVPADFGLVALATAMIAAIGIFGEFGFELALIQNQRAERSHYDTAWTLGMLRGLTAAIIIALLSEPLAYFFNDPRLRDVILALALAPLLEGFYNIGTVAFRKELTLNKEFIFRIVPRIAGVAVTIAFALAWRNYWALVCGTLAGVSLRVALSYLMHSYRPRISTASVRQIMGFSKWMLATAIMSFANQKAGTFIVAKLLDTASLGIFSLASEIANFASSEVIAPVKQALFPAYAKLAHDTPRLRKAFLDAYGILVLLALPVAIGIGLTADYFVPILLGPKWVDAIPLIQILVISGGLNSLSTHARPVYLALNRPDLDAYASLGRVVVFLPMLIFGLLQYGIMGAAIAQSTVQIGVFLGCLYLMHRMIHVGVGDILTACWRPFVACALMALSVGAIKWLWPMTGTGLTAQLIHLTVAVLTGVLVYAGGVLLLWLLSGRPSNSAESHILSHLARFHRKNRSFSANLPSKEST
jgi:O-antigen/teichoic acid export membrane protein